MTDRRADGDLGPARDGLIAVFEEARTQGFLGPGPVADHLDHATGFARAFGGRAPGAFLDLGSGAGLPGLVLAAVWPAATAVLVEGSTRRAAFLDDAIRTLDWAERVAVQPVRAELAGRDPELRGAFDLVTARGFGPPAVTAECGAPFLELGGVLLVSEPPDALDDRWPSAGLGELGLVDRGALDEWPRIRRLEQGRACPDRYPRRVGIPAKRPLF